MSDARRTLALALALLLAPAVMADLKVVQRTTVDGTVGGKRHHQETESVQWIGPDRMRSDTGDTSVIVRLDLGKVLLVDHGKKTYTEIPIPVDITKYMPEEMRQMMAAMMQFEVKVTPRDETRKVGAWTARRYDVTMTSPMLEMRQTMWATREIPVDVKAYVRMARQLLAIQPQMQALADEMAKVEGYVVLQEGTVTTMGGTMTTRQEVVSVEKGDPPAGWYEPPEGYTRETFDPMKMMQRTAGG